MPAHYSYGKTRAVRWNRKEGYFEMFCPSCSEKKGTSYWPLTIDEFGQPEFWKPSNMQTCRGCINEAKRMALKKRNATDPAFRERRRQEAAAYYAENKAVVNFKHRIYMQTYRKKKDNEEGAA